jgi:hypothetical protein
VKIPRQILIKGGLDFTTANKVLEKCKIHPSSGVVYDFFITNNMSGDREKWGVYARVLGVEKYNDEELSLD